MVHNEIAIICSLKNLIVFSKNYMVQIAFFLENSFFRKSLVGNHFWKRYAFLIEILISTLNWRIFRGKDFEKFFEFQLLFGKLFLITIWFPLKKCIFTKIICYTCFWKILFMNGTSIRTKNWRFFEENDFWVHIWYQFWYKLTTVFLESCSNHHKINFYSFERWGDFIVSSNAFYYSHSRILFPRIFIPEENSAGIFEIFDTEKFEKNARENFEFLFELLIPSDFFCL